MLKNILPILVLMVLVSCETNMVRSEYKATNDGYWNKDNTISFKFTEQDTITKTISSSISEMMRPIPIAIFF